MLFMKKDIERVFSNVIANRIYKGSRFDLDDGDYISSEFKFHVNLISETGEKVIIFTRTEFPTALYSPNSREFVICERKGKEDKVLYRFYQYKQVYTNSLEEFKEMESKGSERDRRRYAKEQTTVLTPEHVLPIIRRHAGFKRTKADDIISVEKFKSYDGFYFNILVGKNDKYHTINISRTKRR
jgi:hypothetical protein